MDSARIDHFCHQAFKRFVGQTYLSDSTSLLAREPYWNRNTRHWVIVAIIVCFLQVGYANYFGKSIVKAWDAFLDRIPFIRSIYSPLRNFLNGSIGPNSIIFKGSINEYPRKGIYSLCFQTSKELGEVKIRRRGDGLVIFQQPQTTSGYIVLVPQNEVKDSR
ncbi:MAG: hypothetical protein Ct9H90mP13_05200 [Pseudomonadota bacterium]|nr:MAG: hypothetical protein Ct9H90mP13_05200 [Pseudomonadota bacterium]